MIIDIIGSPYEGKTLYMTYKCKQAHDKGLDCWTTYYTKYSKRLENLNQLDTLNYVDDAHTFIGLDDFVSWLDCRNTSSNTAYTWIFNKYRKKGLVIVYDEQVLGSIDFRLGNITDLFMFTRQIKFPVFKIKPTLIDGTLAAEPFIIKYGKDVYDAFNTLEIVEKRIRLSDLIKIKDSIIELRGSTKLFGLRLKAKYGIGRELGEIILSLVEAEKNEVLKEVFNDIGYTYIPN